MKPFFKPEPVIFFNTQDSKTCPGNTIPAITEAFDNGADVVCLNIQFSKDNVIMAISDSKIDNLCEASGLVSEYSSDELKSFDAGFRFTDQNGDFIFQGKGYKFVTLEDILQAFPDKRFNLTIMHKDKKMIQAYAGLIKKYNAADRILTSSMYGKNIKFVRKLIPGSATAFTLAGIIGVYALFKSGLLYFVRGFKADALQTPESIGVSYFSNSGLISQLHMKGIRVHVWYVKDRIQLKRVFDAGADGYMIDDIPMVKSFLAENIQDDTGD